MSNINAPLASAIVDSQTGKATPAWTGFFSQVLPAKLNPTSVGDSLATSVQAHLGGNTSLTGNYQQDSAALQLALDKIISLEAALKAQTLVKS